MTETETVAETGILVGLVRSPIDAAAVARHLEERTCGGRVVFEGVVRDHHDGRAVTHLEYEAYEDMALSQMREIAAEMQRRWPARRVALVHRVGELAIGDVAVVVGVATAHRAEAFEACRFGIDTIKADVPIWKHEFYADGTSAWQENAC